MKYKVKNMKYKVGDRVRIVDNEGTAGLAEINDIAYIKKIDESRVPYCCKIIGKDTIVWLCEGDITKADYTWEDFEKCPIGTKVTFESGKILFKQDNSSFQNHGFYRFYREYDKLFEFKDNYNILGKIIKIEEPTYTTVYEPTEEVEEMTIAELEKKLGYKIKIVKEK